MADLTAAFDTRQVHATDGSTGTTLAYQTARRVTATEKVDAVLIHKVWGLLIFAAVMGTLFTVERFVRELQTLRDSLGLDEVHLYTAVQQHAAFNWFVNAQTLQRGVLAAGAQPAGTPDDPPCPVCGGTMEEVYSRPHQKVCACKDCQTTITVPVMAWELALTPHGRVLEGATSAPRIRREDDPLAIRMEERCKVRSTK